MTTTKEKIMQASASSENEKHSNVLSPARSKPDALAREMKHGAEKNMPMPALKAKDIVSRSYEAGKQLSIPQAQETKEEKVRQETRIPKYADIINDLNQYTPPTEEELEAERKKRKRKAVLSAVTDGLTAFSNLFFTTKGAPATPYNPNASLSARNKARWDTLDKIRDEKMNSYYKNLLSAEMADRKESYERARWDERMRHDLELADRREGLENTRYKNRAELQDDRQEATAEQKQKEMDFKAEQNNLNRKTKIDTENTRQAGQNLRASMNNETSIQKANIARSGKQTPFYDEKNKPIYINDNVWKANMERVYEALVEEGIEPGIMETGTKGYTKDGFVKANWHKSAKARAIIQDLAAIPASNNETPKEDIEEWTPEEEMEEWTPDKK